MSKIQHGEEPNEQLQTQTKRRQRTSGGRAPKHPSSQMSRQSNKRLYDLRRWHKRKTSDKMRLAEPPTGWVLVWEGRFKRWKRRWFVVHLAGLLLYYKNSDRLGQPGCISLEGANVSPVPGKERQFRIRRGSRIYYLRTLNRDNRQAWLETIDKSIRTYERLSEKVGLERKAELFMASQHSSQQLPEEWIQQEQELHRRLAAKMQGLEPVQQAFLQQLQVVQHSLSALSSVLGFSNGTLSSVATGSHGGGYMSVPLETLSSVSQPPATASVVQNSDVKSHLINVQCGGIVHSNTDLFAHSADGKSNVFAKTGGSPTDMILLQEESSTIRTENQIPNGIYLYTNGVPEEDSHHKQGSCIGREFFRLKRREFNSTPLIEKGHTSDSDVCNPTNPKRLSLSGKDGIVKHKPGSLPFFNSVDNIHMSYTNGSLDKEAQFETNQDIDFQHSNKGAHSLQKGPSSDESSYPVSSKSSANPTQGQLHAAWNVLQDTFAEILKEEIQRVIELEAENAALQQSLALLPQLQQNHIKEQMERERLQVTTADMDEGCEEDEDTDDAASLGISDATNEDYFEALEVLNQHEYISKTSSSEELGERVDFSQEPPEEGDLNIDSENMSEVEGEDYEHPRTRLPAPRPLQRGFSLWSVLKNAIGKDLNHITMPATINEPLSVLQKCAEELQHSHLLDKASQLEDSIERLVWVSVFACATYHGSPHRDAKPFNPLLGETYEWQAVDGRLRFIAEQVSHHPPILAFHCDNTSSSYSLYGEVEIKNRFWGKSVEVVPAGKMHLRIPRFDDHFTWSKVTTCIHNVVVGKLWIDNYGELVIRNHATGETSRIRFHKANSSDQGQVTGKFFDKNGMLKCSIHGNYMKEISIVPEAVWSRSHAYDDNQCIWKAPPPPEDYKKQYCFSRFAIGLNELTPQLRDMLPPTDSRFRPDQRALEDGDLEKATPEKIRLEEKQRDAYRKRREQRQAWNCMWFQQRVQGVSQVNTVLESDEEPAWIFNGQYWDARERQDWKGCPDIM